MIKNGKNWICDEMFMMLRKRSLRSDLIIMSYVFQALKTMEKTKWAQVKCKGNRLDIHVHFVHEMLTGHLRESWGIILIGNLSE